MRRNELELRRIVRSLAKMRGSDPQVAASRQKALASLGRTIARMRSLVDDCIAGRTAFEQSVMQYRVRVEFPLFSHLGSLSRITSEKVDWFCA